MARLRHIAIATKDPAKTAAFYQKVFGLKFVKQVPDSPRGGGVFLSDGHINFAFLNYPSDEAADMVGGASYEGLHHMGFQVDDIEEAKARLKPRRRRNCSAMPWARITASTSSRRCGVPTG